MDDQQREITEMRSLLGG
ncbi:MAG: hypothetical protein M3143_12175 [Actinomycetota bacterium]|nr:hypothetical protein [Actinomycetota bacterium]